MYREENELTPKMMVHSTNEQESSGEMVTEITMPASEDTEYGKLGALVFKLRYLTDRNALVVSVVRCRGLPGKSGNIAVADLPGGVNGKAQLSTDPYVKLQLLPEKQHKVKTR